MNSIESVVASKENIQPLRQGRDTSLLSASLQAETDTEAEKAIEKQRNEFEIRLRSQQMSEDPLAAWCEYIHWIEQVFPRQPKEGKLNVVLQKCLNKFKDCTQYMNDERFVKLCIKYADLEDHSLELLSQIHRHGIGVSCAELYIAWAEKFALNDCFKQANQIYEKGVAAQAKPKEVLEQAQSHFHAFLVRKMLNEKEAFQPTLESNRNSAEVRQACNVLRQVSDGRKEVVPSVRIGGNVAGPPGKLPLVANKEPIAKANTKIKIYQGSENEPIGTKAKLDKIPSKKILTKENTQKPGAWTNKGAKNALFALSTTTPSKFEVHRDESSEQDFARPHPVAGSVLKAHKPKKDFEDSNFATAPLFYPEPYDPTKKSMYCKELVYAGGMEFQFEELRAIKYRLKYEELQKQKQPKTEELPQVQETPSVVKPKIEKKKGKSDAASERKSNGEAKRKPLASRIKVEEVPAKAPCRPEDVLPVVDYSINQTINTKEALSEMQQLWFSKPASPLVNVNNVLPEPGKAASRPFSLYVDESCLGNLKAQADPLDLSVRVDNSPDVLVPLATNSPQLRQSVGRKLTYQIYSDNKKVDQKPAIAKEPERKILEVPNQKCNVSDDFAIARKPKCLMDDDEDKENDIPNDYCGPVGKSTRQTTGILTPAENVPSCPLSDQESDEDEEQDDFSVLPCNTTAMTETCNFTKAFQFPRNYSTPNPRKSTMHRADLPQLNESIFSSDLEKRPNALKKTDPENDQFVPEPKKTSPKKEEYYVKNLSVIAETSREYKSSSSGSGGSTLAKNFPYTPSEAKSIKCSMTSSHFVLQKTRGQSLTGYEASTEFSHYTIGIDRVQAIEDGRPAVPVESVCETAAQFTEKLKISKNLEENVDPFSEKVIENLLASIGFPSEKHLYGFFVCRDLSVGMLKIGSSLMLGDDTFHVKKVLGEGAYAKVYRIAHSATSENMIAKVQKPAFPWEFYITREVQSRIGNKDLVSTFMNVEAGFFFENASVLLTKPVEYGDLLSTINKMKQGQIMCQLLSMYFTVQILEILETLHSCQIIHADIKPDNFLVININNRPRLQLIDFGRSIDMTLFPEGTTFSQVVTTEGFTCIEMQTGRRWTYQIDLYGAANCGHCLLFGDYMKVAESNGVWNITKIIPRYWARTEWKNFFVTLLNIESCDKLPDLSALRDPFNEILQEDSELDYSITTLLNVLNNR